MIWVSVYHHTSRSKPQPIAAAPRCGEVPMISRDLSFYYAYFPRKAVHNAKTSNDILEMIEDAEKKSQIENASRFRRKLKQVTDFIVHLLKPSRIADQVGPCHPVFANVNSADRPSAPLCHLQTEPTLVAGNIQARNLVPSARKVTVEKWKNYPRPGFVDFRR